MSDEQHNEVMKRAMKIEAELLANCQAIAADDNIPEVSLITNTHYQILNEATACE